MFAALEDLIERRILQAREEGAFEGLPGEGRPLELEDDRLVPEELRAALRVLKNAGCVPPELEKLVRIERRASVLGAGLEYRRAIIEKLAHRRAKDKK